MNSEQISQTQIDTKKTFAKKSHFFTDTAAQKIYFYLHLTLLFLMK